MSDIVWSKFEPGVWAEVLAGPDHHGASPATIFNSKHVMAHVEGMDTPQPFNTIINLDEWSEVELSPTPESVPVTAYLGLFGDPAVPDYKVYENEKDAKRALKGGSWGYIPIMISRTMIPPAS